MRYFGVGAQSGRTQKTLIIKLITVFLSIQVVLLALFGVTITVIDGTRAYTAGSEYYAIGQKSAAYSLLRFAISEDPAEYERFQSFMEIPLGDGAALEEMQREDMDWDAARAGLRRGRNHESDIPILILMFRLAGETALMRPAVEIWQEADQKIQQLDAAGQRLHDAIAKGEGTAVKAAILEDVHRLDQRLTELEFDFAAAVGAIALQVKTLAVAAILALSVVLWGIAITVGLRIAMNADRSEAAVIQSNARFQDIADTAADWIWETDADGRFTFVSQNVEYLLQVDREAVLGAQQNHVLSGAGVTAGIDALSDAYEKREPFRDLKISRKSPEGDYRHFALRGKPVFDDNGAFSGFRGTGTDITQQVESERTIMRAAVAANEANQAKTMFLANMSHELRTPLNAVIGFSEAMERQLFGALNDNYVEYAGIVRRSGEHLLGMLSDLLDVSRISQGAIKLESESVDIRSIIADSVRDALSAHGNHEREIDIQSGRSVPILIADKMRMRQIVTNLLTNALKFSEPPSPVRVKVSHNERGVTIEVADQGIGISARDIDRVMQPFTQAESGMERKRQGAGLGLPLVKQLVELHGGTFSLQSELGKGTVALVFIPAARVIS